MRGVAVLLALATAAAAQDEFYETVWIVGEDGELLGWPDPEHGEAMERTFKPFVMFDPSPGGLFEDLCPWAMALFVVPGPADLVSLCDPERHLKKTNQNLFDEGLLLGFNADWTVKSRSDPALRRPFLDTLLGWRVLTMRGVQEAAPMLKGMSEEGLDPITRLAAAEMAAMLHGQKLPAIELPPLDGVPTNAGVLVVVDQRRIPPWRDVWKLHRTVGIRETRQTMARVGAAVTPADLCFAQWYVDRECEAFYELVRRFGNARIHRTVLALRFPEDSAELSDAEILLRCEGLFEPDLFKAGSVATGVEPGEGDKGAVTAQFGDVDVTVAPDRLVVSRNCPVPAVGGGLPADLAKLGLGGDDAIWIHCRRVPFADQLPIKGIESLTLRIRFEGGVTVRADATFRDEAAVRAAKARIDSWTPDLTPVELREADARAIARLKPLLESLKVSTQGATLVAEASAPGQTPESLFAGVIELAALYD